MVTSVALAGICLGSRLGAASIVNEGESKFKAKAADLKALRNILSGMSSEQMR